MVETREWVNRAELLRKLSWVLGVDLNKLESIRTLEFYKHGVEVDLGYAGYDKVFIPWERKRKGIGSALVEQHHRADEVDQFQLIPSDE